MLVRCLIRSGFIIFANLKKLNSSQVQYNPKFINKKESSAIQSFNFFNAIDANDAIKTTAKNSRQDNVKRYLTTTRSEAESRVSEGTNDTKNYLKTILLRLKTKVFFATLPAYVEAGLRACPNAKVNQHSIPGNHRGLPLRKIILSKGFDVHMSFNICGKKKIGCGLKVLRRLLKRNF